ncbi:hypothetical protein HAX54_020526, partial [Datura stramonium]|nr:hypothetical protein [Datura stramonium]
VLHLVPYCRSALPKYNPKVFEYSFSTVSSSTCLLDLCLSFRGLPPSLQGIGWKRSLGIRREWFGRRVSG